MIDPLLPSAQLADDPILEPPALPSMCTGGLGARAKEKTEKKQKKPKDNCFAHPFGGSCDHPSYETSTGKVKVWLQRV